MKTLKKHFTIQTSFIWRVPEHSEDFPPNESKITNPTKESLAQEAINEALSRVESKVLQTVDLDTPNPNYTFPEGFKTEGAYLDYMAQKHDVDPHLLRYLRENHVLEFGKHIDQGHDMSPERIANKTRALIERIQRVQNTIPDRETSISDKILLEAIRRFNDQNSQKS